jgi:uncharacterized membrane protein
MKGMKTMPSDLPVAGRTKNHSIHPLLVPFPIAFFVIAMLSDVGYGSTGLGGFAAASFWLIGAGLISAIIAGVAGILDFLYSERAIGLNDVRFLAAGSVALVILQCLNFTLRQANPADGILPRGLLLSAVSVMLMLMIGWRGSRQTAELRGGVIERRRD